MSQPQFLAEYVYILCFAVLVSVVQPWLELRFVACFSEKKGKTSCYIFYMLLSLAISAIEFNFRPEPSSFLLLIIRIALLWGFSVVFLKNQATLSLLAAITAKTVTLLSAGITASISLLITPAIINIIFTEMAVGGLIFGLLGQFFTFALIIAAYLIILRKFKWPGTLPSQYLSVFFLPVLVVLTVEQYISNQVYGNILIIENAEIIKPFADHWQILFIQLFACFSLFSTLYACQRLTEDFFYRTRLLLLERETTAQRNYLEESRARYEKTQSFRHDIKHHLLALAGLLEREEMGKAKEYLCKLEGVTDTLSFLCKTDNTVVDTVLDSKLSVALQNGIQVECTVKIPSPCIVDDLDWCILFSNSVDNAIHACSKQKEEARFIRISGKQKGDFFMIEVENSCLSHGTYEKGIGLTNIEAVSVKYHGAVTSEKREDCFKLNVLLVVSRHLNDISVKPH